MERKSAKGYRLLLGYLGIFIIQVGIINLIPLIILIFYPSESQYLLNFLIPGLLYIVIGFLLTLLIKGRDKEKFARHEDAVFLVLIWVVAIFLSSIPYLLYGFDLTISIFESTSGYSTSGLNIHDVENLPRIYVFFKTILLLFGGVGLVLIITSSVTDKYGLKLYYAEGHQEKFMSNLAKSTRLILIIYLSYILVGVICYMLLGLNLFDSVIHAISAVSTGGYSNPTESIGFNSIGIEIVTVVLMLLGGTSFLIHAMLFNKQFKKAFYHSEWLVLIIILVSFVSMMFLNLISNGIDSFNAIRYSVFYVTSSITTTGSMITNDLSMIPSFSLMLLVFASIVGGQVGSTSGALKQQRIALAVKSSFWYIRDKMSNPRTIRSNFIVRYGKKEVVSDVEIRHNYAFIIIYLTILFIGSLIFMANGHDFQTAIFDMSSSLGGTGFSSGLITSQSNLIVIWTSIFGMFIGRLEFTVLAVFIMKIILDVTKKNIL